MILPNIETFIGCESSFEEASIVLYGAPFDSTTSFRPGARFGPAAMRHESFGLETYSPYQDRDLMDIRVSVLIGTVGLKAKAFMAHG